MKTPLAILNLLHQGVKTLVSVGGVAFALLLVFMQLGFMGAVSDTATNVLEKLDFDAVIRPQEYLHLYEPGEFDRKWLRFAEGTEGVATARPLWVTLQNWRKMPTAKEDQGKNSKSKYLPIAVMAFEPGHPVFKLDDVQLHLVSGRLAPANALLIDEATQAEYGAWDGKHFSDQDIGRRPEVGAQAYSISGTFKLGTGLAANGAVIMNPQGFSRLMPWDMSERISLGLLKLDNRTESQEAVLQRLRKRLGRAAGNGGTMHVGEEHVSQEEGVVEVLSRQQALQAERERWLWQTPIGLIFQLGVVLSLLVGSAIVYMVLATDVANRLPEYATLLAIGYSKKYLSSVVLTQACVLNVLGFGMAYVGAELLYRLTSAVSSIPLTMNSTRAISVLCLGFVMCAFSGMLALRKLWKAEPASLF